MWAVSNQTPYQAEGAWTRDIDGKEVWQVAVKATFQIQDDQTLTVANNQEPICQIPQFAGESGSSHLLRERDFAHRKKATDVIVNGHAYSVNGPKSRVDVSMQIGSLRKRIAVFGNRTWKWHWGSFKPGEPDVFERMPLIYEKASVGPEYVGKEHIFSWNPIGVGFQKKRLPKELEGCPLPNLEDPDDLIIDPGKNKKPTCTGFIPGEWMPRAPLAGTYDDNWRMTRSPLYPDDFDPGFFQAAPEDQRYDGFIRGGTLVSLENLTPDGLLEFKLPKIRLGFQTKVGRQVYYHQGQLNTLIIEPDERKVIAVWHSSFPCHEQIMELQHTTVYEKKAK